MMKRDSVCSVRSWSGIILSVSGLWLTNILAEMTGQLGTYNDNIRQGSLALVRNTNALSVLVETAYLINPYDNAMLVDTSFQKHCAKAIADGIEKFLKNFP